MKIAIQSNTWSNEIHTHQLGQMLAEIAAAGYQGVEIGAHRLDQDHPEVLTQSLQENGLELAGIHTHGELFSAEAMQAAMPRILQAIEFAAAVKSPNVMFSGKIKPGKTDSDQAHEAQMLNQIGEIVHQHGMNLCYHNHYWEIEHQQKELHYLVEHTNPEYVSLLLDVGWVHRAGARPEEVIPEFLPRIRAFHFKDFRVKDAVNDTWTELGQGYVNFPQIWELIRGKGDYWIIVERDETMPNPAESAQISARYLKNLLAA
jgi:sugar phosphate isomerase/epimerase